MFRCPLRSRPVRNRKSSPKTTLADVRAHLREEHADEEAEDEPAAKLLAAGAFAFVRDGGAGSVKVEEEGDVKAKELGDPITVKTTRAAD